VLHKLVFKGCDLVFVELLFMGKPARRINGRAI
jgi:hypothetical protein